jgi:hypothetical protein
MAETCGFMIKKKVCLLGAASVGKTSLVRRFVQGIFSDRYLTTLGVRIDRKIVSTPSSEATLIIWDLAGEDEFATIQRSYLRGASGYILVADGLRPATLDKALELQTTAKEVLGAVPFVLALNKADLSEEWSVLESRIEDLRTRGWRVCQTSAKTGSGVNEMFTLLAEHLVSSIN